MPRETTSNWCIKCALDYFQPVYDLLHKYLVKREVLHADETVCQVLHEKGKAASSNSYMWIYLTGNDGLPSIMLYDCQPGRAGDYAKEFLKGFTGLLECETVCKNLRGREKELPFPRQRKRREVECHHLQPCRDGKGKPPERVPISLHSTAVHAGLQR